MHVLVATDGSIETDRAVSFASTLAGDDGAVTVATVVRVPRTLVADLRSQFGESPSPEIDSDAEYVERPTGTGSPVRKSWPGDDAVVDQYLGNKRVEFCSPIVEAIRTRGITAKGLAREADDPADEIMALASELGADVVVVGSHGHGAFQGLLGSTGAKLVRRSPCPVLVIRGE